METAPFHEILANRPLLDAFLAALGAVLAAFTLVWLISLAKRDVSIVDIAWGPAFLLSAAIFAGYARDLPPGEEARISSLAGVYLGLLALWALRLAWHIAARHEGEDKRYTKMRDKAGPGFAYKSLVTVFYLQAALVAIICLPHLFIQLGERPPEPRWSDWLGIALFAVGFFFEAVGDWQLQRFRADPANQGKVLRTGLWRYTRHPNYFGDAVMWLGFFFGALGSLGGWVTFVSFALELFLLLKVSGVVLLEKTIVHRRPEYRDYIETTPAFFPWFPKSKAGL